MTPQPHSHVGRDFFVFPPIRARPARGLRGGTSSRIDQWEGARGGASGGHGAARGGAALAPPIGPEGSHCQAPIGRPVGSGCSYWLLLRCRPPPKAEAEAADGGGGALRQVAVCWGRDLRGLLVDATCGAVGVEEGSAAFEAAMSRCHERGAERLLQGALRNGGLYVKLGQGLCAMGHILPQQYPAKLRALEDKAITQRGQQVTGGIWGLMGGYEGI
ncbi:uncharacterized aarF domain-containing protein kinase 5 [Excalfactoria chinensis]|uniref:uncharacterized aarF domain-containing protein kinase 5 n=1 Tax=Excalfactoria chinensis TaxID=46218 RepID=UPI003B3ACEDB